MRVVKINDAISYSEPQLHGCRPLLGAISSNDEICYIDCGASFRHREEFRQSFANTDDSKTAFTILTHGHWDHYAGGKGNSKLIASKKSAEDIEKQKKEGIKSAFSINGIMAEYNSTSLPEDVWTNISIDKYVDSDMNLYIGKNEIIMHVVDTDHCDGNIIVELPKHGIVFIGDSIYTNEKDNRFSYTKKIIDTLAFLIDLNAKTYLGSHSEIFTKDILINRMKKYQEMYEFSGNIFSVMELKQKMLKMNGVVPGREIVEEYNWFIEGNRRQRR